MQCRNNCIEEYSDKCVLYTGPDFPSANIKGGQTYDKVVVELLNQLKAIMREGWETTFIPSKGIHQTWTTQVGTVYIQE